MCFVEICGRVRTFRWRKHHQKKNTQIGNQVPRPPNITAVPKSCPRQKTKRISARMPTHTQHRNTKTRNNYPNRKSSAKTSRYQGRARGSSTPKNQKVSAHTHTLEKSHTTLNNHGTLQHIEKGQGFNSLSCRESMFTYYPLYCATWNRSTT